MALGGRAAERVVFDELTTGAESDIQNLTQVARGMVGRWGMSDAIGAVAVTDGRQDGGLLPGSEPASTATQQLVDEEVRRIVEGAEQDVIDLLSREAGATRRPGTGAVGPRDARPGGGLRGGGCRSTEVRRRTEGQGRRGRAAGVMIDWC